MKYHILFYIFLLILMVAEFSHAIAKDPVSPGTEIEPKEIVMSHVPSEFSPP